MTDSTKKQDMPKKKINATPIKQGDLFSGLDYRPEHSFLNRAEYNEGRGLPEEIFNVTAFPPTALLHSNLFMFDTRGREWMLRRCPIFAKWLPSEFELDYTGQGLSSFDLRVMVHIIKNMEKREALNQVYMEAVINEEISKDSSYEELEDWQKKNYRTSVLNKFQNMEGVFLTQADFEDTVNIHSGGDSYKRIKESVLKMSSGVLRVKTNFTDGRENFERPSQLFYAHYIPERKAYYVSFPPIMMDLFGLRTSMVNMKIMTGIQAGAVEKQRNGYYPSLYSMICTYSRESEFDIPLHDIMIKSPYYMMKLQHDGAIPKGSIIDVQSGSTIDGKGITMQQLKVAISKTRTSVLDTFSKFQELSMMKFVAKGRGIATRIKFRIPKALETRGMKSIESQIQKGAEKAANKQAELNLDDK